MNESMDHLPDFAIERLKQISEKTNLLFENLVKAYKKVYATADISMMVEDRHRYAIMRIWIKFIASPEGADPNQLLKELL